MLLPSRCPVCGAAGPAPCAPCVELFEPAPALAPPPGVDACHAVMAYRGAGRELVARVKYRNARSGLPWLVAAMAGLAPRAIDVVTWIPTTPARRRRRGFDQSELLARRVAARLGVPCRRLLRRPPGPAQTGRSRAERWDGPELHVVATVPARVLLVDDVVTSGATAAIAARALRAAGAVAVAVVAAARTPAR